MSYSRRYRDSDYYRNERNSQNRDSDYYRNARDYLSNTDSDYYGTNDQNRDSDYYRNERSNGYARNDSDLPEGVYRGEQGRFRSAEKEEVSTRNCDPNRPGDCYASDYLRRHNVYRSKVGQFSGGGDSYPRDCNPNRAGDCDDDSADEYDHYDSRYRRNTHRRYGY